MAVSEAKQKLHETAQKLEQIEKTLEPYARNRTKLVDEFNKWAYSPNNRKRIREDAQAAFDILFNAVDSTRGEELQELIQSEVLDDFEEYVKTDEDRERLGNLNYLILCIAHYKGEDGDLVPSVRIEKAESDGESEESEEDGRCWKVLEDDAIDVDAEDN